MGPERAEICTKKGGQHVNSLVDQINSGPTCSGFMVHGRVRMDKVRHVGDVCMGDQHPETYTGQTRTYERQPRCCRWEGGAHAMRRLCLGSLGQKSVIQPSRRLSRVRCTPGGSMLQIMRPRKSSLSLQLGSVALWGGTTQLSPSGGRQSRIALPKGL